MTTSFGDWLIEQMQKKGWSQSDLSRASGLTRQAISYYLTERSKNPDEAALRKLAKAFKLPPELVFEKAGKLPVKTELSPIKRQIMHLAEQADDEDLEMLIAMLEKAAERKGRTNGATSTSKA